MKLIKTVLGVLLTVCVLTAAVAGNKASSMHYGNAPIKSSGYPSIVITNYSDEFANVTANFVDGSSNTMTIYPYGDYPRNVISIDDPYPYVDIMITADDGTLLFPEQAVYPGQHVDIGSPDQKSIHVTVH